MYRRRFCLSSSTRVGRFISASWSGSSPDSSFPAWCKASSFRCCSTSAVTFRAIATNWSIRPSGPTTGRTVTSRYGWSGLTGRWRRKVAGRPERAAANGSGSSDARTAASRAAVRGRPTGSQWHHDRNTGWAQVTTPVGSRRATPFWMADRTTSSRWRPSSQAVRVAGSATTASNGPAWSRSAAAAGVSAGTASAAAHPAGRPGAGPSTRIRGRRSTRPPPDGRRSTRVR